MIEIDPSLEVIEAISLKLLKCYPSLPSSTRSYIKTAFDILDELITSNQPIRISEELNYGSEVIVNFVGVISEGERIMEKEIRPFVFPHLKKLEITNKGLTSVEGLSRISMPVLEKLDLRSNDISEAKGLRKLKAPNLR